jgi:tetratricopeptide (TPR) repeat protein
VYRAEGQRAATLRPEQVEADDLAMRGWAVWLRGMSRENIFEALRLFDEAVARDPDSLRGWGGVGLMNGHAANYGWLADPAPARARQREALHHMERIDSEDMTTYFARVDPYYRRQDFAGLLQLAQTLVERFPNHTWSHQQHAAALMQLGRFDECIPPLQHALRLGPRDPSRPVFRGMASFCHFAAGRYAEAVAEARQAVQGSPRGPMRN